MTLETYKSQGHPLARFTNNDEIEDINVLVANWAYEEGHGQIENRGEFVGDTEEDLTYALYDDDGTPNLFTIEGSLNGEILVISHIDKK